MTILVIGERTLQKNCNATGGPMVGWPATEAKAKFSELLDRTEEQGPQLVRRRKREFYVMTREQREALLAGAGRFVGHSSPKTKKPVGTLADSFRNSPLAGSGLKIERISLHPRPIDF